MALLRVPLHLQDRYDLCGPACAQMVSRFRGAPLSPQSTATIGQGNAAWFTTPAQMAALVNGLGPAGAQPFKVRTATTFATAMSHITASLAESVPPVVLIDSGEHWVVVRGITGTGAGRFIHYRDPFPDRTLVPNIATPLPPHRDNDDCDDHAESTGAEVNAAGFTDEAVRWNEWRTGRLTKCGIGGPPWKNKFVVVAPTFAAVPQPEPIALPVSGPAQPILEPVAISLARAAMESSEFMNDAGWAEAVRNPDYGAMPQAIRVERLDGGRPYLLVRLTNRDGRGVVVQLDAETGELMGARLMPRRVAQSLMAAPAPGHRRYVWRSSANSFYSPYFPFSEMTDATSAPVYVRVLDRRRFRDVLSPARPA